jgi:excinuclease ABC subunit C
LVLATQLEFDPGHDAELFATVPAVPGVFLLRAARAGSEPYISKTANLRRRLQRLLGPPAEQSRRINLRELVRWIEYTPTGSDFESGFLVYKLLRACFPKTYSERLRLRFAPLVKLHLGNPYPRASITTRLGAIKGDLTKRSVYYGPFVSRAAAEKFANDSLDFFKMRRCVDDLNPDPAFPGCIYSEMKMCLAPCFQGCSDEEYQAEVSRVETYFDSRGDSLLQELSARRDSASANLDFESAANLHAQIAKLKPVLSQAAEIVGPIDRLSALIVQPGAVENCVNLFLVEKGLIFGPIAFPIQPPEHAKTHSMEGRIGEFLAEFPVSEPETALELMEHLAILKRWYYRGTKIGEIFFAERASREGKATLPMRRIVRGIGRVLRGETPAPPLEPAPTGEPQLDFDESRSHHSSE